MSARLLRRLAAFALLALGLACLSPNAAAQEASQGFDPGERASQAIDEFYDEMPESARDYISSSDAASISPAAGLAALLERLAADMKNYVKEPLRILGLAAGAAALCALASAACAGAKGAEVVNIAGAAYCAVCVAASLSSLAEEAARAAERAASLSAAFVPVFAGLLVSSGRAGTGAFYSAAVTAAQSVFAGLLTTVIKPLVGVLLGLSAVSGIRESGITGLVNGARKLALWLIGGASTLFCGVVKLQTSVTASADSLALRASRFAVSGAFPVIGRSVSEALATVSGGLSVIRGTVGTAGIIALAGIFAPVALRCALCSASLSLAAAFCDSLGLPPSARAIRGMKAGVDILCAVVVFDAMCIIISTAALIGAGGAGA